MIVSWNWLKDYVSLSMSHEEATRRLAMSGLNHESTQRVGDDLAIDLEVTSNRADCLGHLGIAREIGVLWQLPLTSPQPAPIAHGPAVQELTSVQIESPDLCPRYTARVVRGVKVGPSPKWLADRLTTIGIAVINNVVDITNYVMMECGQPLHAFDLNRLQGRQIRVREARANENLVAIDHRTYPLQPGMCVIADAVQPVALAGVMGGAETEVNLQTTELLIESADFAPLSVRNTARALRLHSPSSYRFERGVDPVGIEWASRRACQMILDLAGGELASGLIDVAPIARPPAKPIVLRLRQVERILGIVIPPDEIRRIITALGNEETRVDRDQIEVIPPPWRRDLTREIDLIEEVARIHGYDQIPEDVGVPMAPSHQGQRERVLRTVRDTLVASGFYEALTPSLVEADHAEDFSPWSDSPSLRVAMPMLRGADHLRKSLIPSLLRVRQINESLANEEAEFFETARVYLPRPEALPVERMMIGCVSARSYWHLKGVLEQLVDSLHRGSVIEVETWDHACLAPGKGVRLQVQGRPIGYLGVLDEAMQRRYQLRQPVTVAEVILDELVDCAQLIPQFRAMSPFPLVRYDLNMIVDDQVRWGDLAATVRRAAGPVLERLDYCETYRDAQKDGRGKKRLLFALQLRAADHTLTGDEADQVRRAVIEACQHAHQASLLV